MMRSLPPERPMAPFGVALAGGVLIVVGAFVIGLFSGPLNLFIFAVLGVIFGTFVLIGSVAMVARPDQHAPWGVVVVVFSAVSIIGFGGFVVGMILGIIGGVLGITWQPGGGSQVQAAGPYGVQVTPWRLCMGCGRWIPWTFNICPLCGTHAPVPSWMAPGAGRSVAAPPPQVAPPPVAPPQPLRSPCPTCSGQAEWVPHRNSWYCPSERKFL